MHINELKGKCFSIEVTPETKQQVIQILEKNGVKLDILQNITLESATHIAVFPYPIGGGVYVYLNHPGVVAELYITDSDFISANTITHEINPPLTC